jgi:hypothetical protein
VAAAAAVPVPLPFGSKVRPPLRRPKTHFLRQAINKKKVCLEGGQNVLALFEFFVFLVLYLEAACD